MTTENNDDDISVRIIIDSDIFNASANNAVTSRLIERLYMRYFIDTLIDELYESIQGEDDTDDRELQYALRESEEMYKYLEKKNISLDIKPENFGKVKNKNNEHECCICKDEFETNSKVTTLECGHLLHAHCIEEWAKYQAKCPICRNELKVKDI